eukprot:6206842-Pleurochrysis_carterae.AAC.3
MNRTLIRRGGSGRLHGGVLVEADTIPAAVVRAIELMKMLSIRNKGFSAVYCILCSILIVRAPDALKDPWTLPYARLSGALSSVSAAPRLCVVPPTVAKKFVDRALSVGARTSFRPARKVGLVSGQPETMGILSRVNYSLICVMSNE